MHSAEKSMKTNDNNNKNNNKHKVYMNLKILIHHCLHEEFYSEN